MSFTITEELQLFIGRHLSTEPKLVSMTVEATPEFYRAQIGSAYNLDEELGLFTMSVKDSSDTPRKFQVIMPDEFWKGVDRLKVEDLKAFAEHLRSLDVLEFDHVFFVRPDVGSSIPLVGDVITPIPRNELSESVESFVTALENIPNIDAVYVHMTVNPETNQPTDDPLKFVVTGNSMMHGNVYSVSLTKEFYSDPNNINVILPESISKIESLCS